MLGGSVAVLVSWLLIAVGGALLLGTAAALMRYRRTGLFPGQPATDDTGAPLRPSVRTAFAKCALGALLLAWGALWLSLAG